MTAPTIFECVDFIPNSIHFAIDVTTVALLVLAGLAVGVWILWWMLKARDYLCHLFWMIHCDGWNLYIIAEEMNRVLDSTTTVQETNTQEVEVDDLRSDIIYRWQHFKIKPETQSHLRETYKLNLLECRH